MNPAQMCDPVLYSDCEIINADSALLKEFVELARKDVMIGHSADWCRETPGYVRCCPPWGKALRRRTQMPFHRIQKHIVLNVVAFGYGFIVGFVLCVRW